jgi:dTDP-4-amino-4,6-dideoxygalactose transaminase
MKETKRIFLSPPHMSGEELQFVKEAFKSNYIAPLGPQVDAFEREYTEKLGFHHAVAVSSGTAAMHLALRILGVQPGDEVIASTLTFIGSVSPIVFQGGVPVFVDSDHVSWNMAPDLLAEEIEACAKRDRLPKAVIPTDLYGQCADLDCILEVCAPLGIPVVADAAEALGATYRGRSAGKGAKAAIFSFNGNKIITTSGGGMLASDDNEFIEAARFLSQQARDPTPHYEHSHLGYNYRMSNILAAIGRGQMQVLEERVEAKRRVFKYYQDALGSLPGIEFMPEAPYGRCTRWLTVIQIHPDKFGADREQVRLALEAENIESRPIWKPMHLQPVFDVCRNNDRVSKHQTGISISQNTARPQRLVNVKHRARVIGGEISEKLFEKGLCLPSGTQMTEEDLARVTTAIKKARIKV